MFEFIPKAARDFSNHWIADRRERRVGKNKCICAVQMYVDITDVPNKQRTSNPVQNGNLPTHVYLEQLVKMD